MAGYFVYQVRVIDTSTLYIYLLEEQFKSGNRSYLVHAPSRA